MSHTSRAVPFGKLNSFACEAIEAVNAEHVRVTAHRTRFTRRLLVTDLKR